LQANADGVLVRSSRADDLSIEVGSQVQVLLARGTRQQKLQVFRVVGMFDTFPGFPEGTDLVVGLGTYTAATRLGDIDFFLVRSRAGGTEAVRIATAALRSGPAPDSRFRYTTVESATNKDQSSLTAVNIHGLLELGSSFAVAMGATAIAMFVLGVVVQRRREYVVLLAHGLSDSGLFGLVLGETFIVGASGLAIGAAVGLVMGKLFVQILRPLFVLQPVATVERLPVFVTAAGLLAASVLSATAATLLLLRIRLSAALRET
jgi:FtsX-like permease family